MRSLLLTAALVPGCQDPVAPDVAPASAVDRPFCRFVEAPDGGRLEVMIAHYRRGETKVALLAAVHVADREYYDALQKRFETYDALLFEMIGDSNLRPHPDMEMAENDVFTMIQSGMGRGFTLVKQWQCIDYRQPNFVHADMTWDEWKAALEAAGTSELGEMMKGGLPESDRDAEARQPRLDLVEAFRSGRGAHEMRIVGARLLVQGASANRQPTVIIEGRNRRCLGVLQEQLDAGKQNLGIFYGAFHMADMERRLLHDHGFELVSEEWITAWDCSAGRFPTAEKGLKRKRYRARADLKKLTEAVAAWRADHPGKALTWANVRAAQADGKLPGRADGVDPWGREYVLRERGGRIDVRCLGSDGVVDTDDDVVLDAAPAAAPADEAKRLVAVVRGKTIYNAVKMYYVSNGSLPDSLVELVSGDARGRKFLERLETDPWGNDYLLYGENGRDFYLVSTGPDGVEGTPDDLRMR